MKCLSSGEESFYCTVAQECTSKINDRAVKFHASTSTLKQLASTIENVKHEKNKEKNEESDTEFKNYQRSLR